MHGVYRTAETSLGLLEEISSSPIPANKFQSCTEPEWDLQDSPFSSVQGFFTSKGLLPFLAKWQKNHFCLWPFTVGGKTVTNHPNNGQILCVMLLLFSSFNNFLLCFLLPSKTVTVLLEMFLFSSPLECNCQLLLFGFFFFFITALYNEKVGVNERKRKRRTTIR